MANSSSLSVPEVIKPRKRIEYIDALRGFTMFLVVFQHVFTFSCSVRIESAFLNILQTFRMPLFFFISGYVGMKLVDYFNTKTYISLIKKKFAVQLIPTVVFSGLMTITGPFSVFNDNFPVSGWSVYWFTIVLLGMFIVYYSLNYLLNRCGLRRNISLIMYGIAIVMYVLVFTVPLKIPQYLELDKTFYYFQFFVLGTIVRQNSVKVAALCKNHVFSTFVFLLFVSTSIMIYNKEVSMFLSDNLGAFWRYLAIFNGFAVRYAGLIMIFTFFLSLSPYFSANGRVSSAMQFVGRRTLDIYMLHFFFIPVLPVCVADFFNSSENIVLQVFFGGGFAVAIIVLCLFVSALIRNSDFLAHYLFGAKISEKAKN